MSLMIYNGLTNKIEEFIPHKDNVVNMYVCGPTVYNYIHIGNARPVIFYDMMKNYLEFLGYKVNYASNITDVDDRIINKAFEEKITEAEITKKYEEQFFKDTQKVGSNKPDFIPHATEYIDDMLNFIGELENKGYAYSVDGDLYFRIHKIKDYGILSNQVQEDLNQGVRIKVLDKKENPLDFTLWKSTTKGLKWDSKYGAGRPGWHTECVVMNHKIFGDQIDIHGGGMDLKFPHHENEIAQAKAMYNHNLAKYWVHVGRLDLDSEKMSKSLGNVILVKDLTEDEAIIIRMIIIFSPYRSNINYSVDLFNQYKKEYEKYRRIYLSSIRELQYMNNLNQELDIEFIDKFIEFMNQDFNVQNVMTLINDNIKIMNQALRNKEYDLLSSKLNAFKKIMDIFGLNLKVELLNQEDLTIYKNWMNARNNKDFTLADSYRIDLANRDLI